jgi:pilus assembly protein CpaB
MGRRTLLLIAALVVAALGTVLVFLYAQNADEREQAGQELVLVIVAKGDIAAGTNGSDAATNGLFEQKQIPKSTLVPGALSDATPLASLVALTPIYTGQQIIAQQWGSPDQTVGLGVPEGKLALSIQLGDPERVAGFVRPGSNVAIFATGGPAVRMLLAPIQVLAVGATTVNPAASPGSSTNPEQVPTAILTLAVTQEEAEKILAAQGRVQPTVYNGLYFALMTDTSEVDPGASPGADATNLFR